jgi:hypothetical protein
MISTASWVMVIVFLDPQDSGIVGRSLFFLSFFLSIFGFASTIGYVSRRVFQRHEPPFRLVATSFRQGILFGILLTVSLVLQSQRLFTWWSALMLVVFLSLIEAFLVAREAAYHASRGGAHGV